MSISRGRVEGIVTIGIDPQLDSSTKFIWSMRKKLQPAGF
jgi:hypothetical protein